MNTILTSEPIAEIPKYGERIYKVVSDEDTQRKMGRTVLIRLSELKERFVIGSIESVNRKIGNISLSYLELAGMPGVMTMARGGNYKNQRLNLQQSGKANAKKPMPPEQKRARKRKRKKK